MCIIKNEKNEKVHKVSTKPLNRALGWSRLHYVLYNSSGQDMLRGPHSQGARLLEPNNKQAHQLCLQATRTNQNRQQ